MAKDMTTHSLDNHLQHRLFKDFTVKKITNLDILIALIMFCAFILSGCGVVPAVSIGTPLPTSMPAVAISTPEQARQAVVRYLIANYAQPDSITSMIWVGGSIPSGELSDINVFQYVADNWIARVAFSAMPPGAEIFKVTVQGDEIIWEGMVDAKGQVVITNISYRGSAQESDDNHTENLTPSPTPTLFPPTITPTAIPPTPTPKMYCDWLAFVKDVTIPDGTAFKPGETFVKTWQLQNRGTCTWTPDYALVFSSGSQMGDTVAVKLSGYVAPGETVDVSVALSAPTTPGNHRGYWMLRNASGTLFGYSDNANKAFYVDIRSVSSSVGTVSGRICFPSEHIPPLNLYLPNMTKNKRIEISIAENQTSYQVQLEPGEYIAYAWTLNFELAGGYTDTQHRLKPFEVKAGHTLTGIDICDWYGEPGTIPLPSPDHFGRISGTLSFPSEQIPPLHIVAFDVYHNSYHLVDTDTNQQTYEIKNLMPGYYTIVAYEKNSGFAGGYSEYAKCGLSPECAEDHTLVTIYIAPGDHFINANPADWYAPAGTFPPDPIR